MRIPKRLEPLMEEGLVDEVIRPITSGKEAEVYIVRSLGVLRAAKVYKESTQRSFKHRADYMEGRRTRNSRDARAKGSKFAREQEEEAWQTSEITALGRLRAAGVRVPEPRGFMDGVLLMDLVLTLEGEPAPRLADCHFNREEARACYETLVNEVKLILCEGLVHGDLSEYNVLLSAYGPVIIDLPQMVHAAANSQARGLFLRDVANLKHFFGRMAPELARARHGEELWDLWERGLLTPETTLSPIPEPRAEGERRQRRHVMQPSQALEEKTEQPTAEPAPMGRQIYEPSPPAGRHIYEPPGRREFIPPEHASRQAPPRHAPPGRGAQRPTRSQEFEPREQPRARGLYGHEQTPPAFDREQRPQGRENYPREHHHDRNQWAQGRENYPREQHHREQWPQGRENYPREQHHHDRNQWPQGRENYPREQHHREQWPQGRENHPREQHHHDRNQWAQGRENYPREQHHREQWPQGRENYPREQHHRNQWPQGRENYPREQHHHDREQWPQGRENYPREQHHHDRNQWAQGRENYPREQHHREQAPHHHDRNQWAQRRENYPREQHHREQTPRYRDREQAPRISDRELQPQRPESDLRAHEGLEQRPQARDESPRELAPRAFEREQASRENGHVREPALGEHLARERASRGYYHARSERPYRGRDRQRDS